MSLSRVKVWGNEILTPADLNAEFNNVLDNAASLISPLPGSLDWDGFAHTLDAAGVTTAQSPASVGWSFIPGSKAGTPSTTGSVSNWAANTFTDTNTALSGTATSWTGHSFQRPTLAASNATVTTTDASTVYIANAPLAGSNQTLTNPWALWVDDGGARFDGLVYASLLRGTAAFGYYIQGLTYANGTDAVNDIDIAPGLAVSSDTTQDARRTILLTSTLTKQLDATWAVGSGSGGLDAGSIGNNDYYIWLIMRSDTGVVDALFSQSSTAPTMPTNYDFKRLIGWVKRVAGTIVAFKTYETEGGGLAQYWNVPTLDVNLANTLTSTRRTDAVKVPLNFSVVAHVRVLIDDATVFLANICSPDETDATVSSTAAPGFNVRSHVAGIVGGSELRVRTSATGTIAAKVDAATMDQYRVITLGFIWSRRN